MAVKARYGWAMSKTAKGNGPVAADWDYDDEWEGEHFPDEWQDDFDPSFDPEVELAAWQAREEQEL